MSAKDKIIIVGIGGPKDIAYQYLLADERYEVVAFSVNEEHKNADSYSNKPLLALEALSQEDSTNDLQVFVTISSGKLNRNREHVYSEVKEMGFDCLSYISTSVFVTYNSVVIP